MISCGVTIDTSYSYTDREILLLQSKQDASSALATVDYGRARK